MFEFETFLSAAPTSAFCPKKVKPSVFDENVFSAALLAFVALINAVFDGVHVKAVHSRRAPASIV